MGAYVSKLTAKSGKVYCDDIPSLELPELVLTPATLPVLENYQLLTSPRVSMMDSNLSTSPRVPMMDSHLPTSPRGPMMDSYLPTSPRVPMMNSHLPTSPRGPMMDSYLPTSPRVSMMDSHLPTSPRPPMMYSKPPISTRSSKPVGSSLPRYIINSQEPSLPPSPRTDLSRVGPSLPASSSDSLAVPTHAYAPRSQRPSVSSLQRKALTNGTRVSGHNSPYASVSNSPRSPERRQSIERCREETVYFALNHGIQDLSNMRECKNNKHIGQLRFKGVYAFCLIEDTFARDIYLLVTSQELPDNLTNSYIWYSDIKQLGYVFEDKTIQIIDNLTDVEPLSSAINQKLADLSEQGKTAPIKINLTNIEFNDLITSNGGHILIEHTQYLIIKSLKDSQSNHGGIGLMRKKMPGYRNNNMEVLTGGEISFGGGKILAWNLKSGSFSQNTVFNEEHEKFQQNFNRLVMPRDTYTSIAFAETIAHHYTDRGSFLKKDSMAKIVTAVVKDYNLTHAKSLGDLVKIDSKERHNSFCFFPDAPNDNAERPPSEKIKLASSCSSDQLDMMLTTESKDEYRENSKIAAEQWNKYGSSV